MGVYIKGMKMPRYCYECKVWFQCFEEKPPFNMIKSVCPLIEVKEPHGRLIDATFEENHYASMLLDPTPDVTEQDKKNARIIIDALRMAGTVIEAEGREK